MELYKIVARNKDRDQAYAEKIYGLKILADGRVMWEDKAGFLYITDPDSIVRDPRIISAVAGGCLYKIWLEDDCDDVI